MIGSLSIWLRRIEGWWLSPASPYPLAAFRIAFGSYLLLYLGSLYPHVEVLFSDTGVYAPYLIGYVAPSPVVAQLLFGAMWVATLCATLGAFTRSACVCVLSLFLYHYLLQLGARQSSFDRLLVIYLIVLCLSDPGQAWSVDALRQPRPAHAQRWAERLVRFQSIILYLGAGLWKAFNPGWQSGEVLYATLMSPWATSLGFRLSRLDLSSEQWALLSWSVVLGEIVLGLLLMFRRSWPLGIAAGVVFHLANTFILVVPEFLVSITPYVFFIQEQRWQRVADRLSRRRARA